MSYYDKQTIRDIDVYHKRVLVRVDFNVPFDADGNINDTIRIMSVRPTVEYLVNHEAKVILISHLGRPKGKIDPRYSLAPVAKAAEKLLGREVKFAYDVVGSEIEKMIDDLSWGGILLLENSRFYEQEEKNDEDFSRRLADLADIYVNDAFATAHRAHSSTEGVAHFLPGVSGFLMEKEVVSLGDALTKPAKPFIAIIGGSKVSDKIRIIERLLDKVDRLLIGGGMANTFLTARGYNMQNSLVEKESLEWTEDFVERRCNGKLLLPIDLIAADSFSDMANTVIVTPDNIPEGWQALDIGPKTVAMFREYITNAGTVFWNGPLGVFEMENFCRGTMRVAESVAECSGFTIIGGGDSAAAIHKAGVQDRINHISTGGGASLEFLGGKILPGIAALLDK